MTITKDAVFTFGVLEFGYNRPYARFYYPVTVFNRKNNKTAYIEVPRIYYENIPSFIEELLYCCDPINIHCSARNIPKTVELLNERAFFQEQAKKLKSISLDLDTIFSELIFGEDENEQDKNV